MAGRGSLAGTRLKVLRSECQLFRTKLQVLLDSTMLQARPEASSCQLCRVLAREDWNQAKCLYHNTLRKSTNAGRQNMSYLFLPVGSSFGSGLLSFWLSALSSAGQPGVFERAVQGRVQAFKSSRCRSGKG